eukprot:361041-Chlamydomonas_euryale.AAC.3
MLWQRLDGVHRAHSLSLSQTDQQTEAQWSHLPPHTQPHKKHINILMCQRANMHTKEGGEGSASPLRGAAALWAAVARARWRRGTATRVATSPRGRQAHT